MKTRYRKWFILGSFLLVFVLAGTFLISLVPHEPSYEGKRLSTWLDELGAMDYSKRWDPDTRPAQAVRAIGTDAIPWLLDQLQVESRWHWQLNQLLAKQPLIKYRFPDPNVRLSRATLGFQALGKVAEPAIPALLKLVEDKPGFVPGALAAIGPASVPALQQCLTNTRAYATSVGQIMPIPGNTIGAIHNTINAGRLAKSDIVVLLPAIRAWAQSTNRNSAQYNYAADFLRDFDH